jgi:hypothetical protein
MVAVDAEHAGMLTAYKLAIVAPQDLTFGMARMYQLFTERDAHQVGVFRTVTEAEAWLGIAPTADD